MPSSTLRRTAPTSPGPQAPASRRLPGARALTTTAAGALAVFAWLAASVVTATALARHDAGVTALAVSLRSSALTVLAQAVSAAGGTAGLTLLTALTAVALLVARRRAHALVLTATMAGSALATTLVKLVFSRERPDVSTLIGDPSSSFSFPSGHSLNTAVFTGLLAAFVVLSARSSRVVGAGAVLVAAAATLCVGLSRVYLGYHWMTDVLAGWVLGLAWLCLVGLVTAQVLRRRAPQS